MNDDSKTITDDQLRRIERLCQDLYASPNADQRTMAQKALRGFTESSDCIVQCQLILDRSQQPYALLLASASLLKLLTKFWNSFSDESTVGIRDYILNYLAQRVSTLPPFVIRALIQVLMRVTKLGWNQSEEHRNICKSITKFLAHTITHCILGLQMLAALVDEMNTQTPSLSLTRHRKVAVSFRDMSLLFVFQMTLTTLNQIEQNQIQCETPEQNNALRKHALGLALDCLSFDYIGTNADDSSEDAGTIQVPSSWRPLIEESDTLRLFFDLFASSQPQEASTCLEILVQLSACRRSLFTSQETRNNFLHLISVGICQILKQQKTQEILLDPEGDCYHHFCRLLGRLKSNYQLQELISMPMYAQWIDLIATFTIKSFNLELPGVTVSSNSLHYLLGLWSRMTMAIPYMKGDVPSFLEAFIPQIREAFLNARLNAIAEASSQDEIDELFEEPDLGDLLKTLPALCRYQYQRTVQYINARVDPILVQYQEGLNALENIQGEGQLQQLQNSFAVVENQLALLTYIMGTIIRGHLHVIHGEDQLVAETEAELCAKAFRILPITDMRNNNKNHNLVQKSVHLELAIVYFLEWFRRAYVGTNDIPQYGFPLNRIGSKASGTSINKQEGQQDDSMPTVDSIDGEDQQADDMYSRLAKYMGPTSQSSIVTAMLDKVVMNLNIWATEKRVVDACLQLLDNLSSGYCSVKMMAKLERVKSLLTHHTADTFPFLNVPANSRLRSTFYTTLARLIFLTENLPLFDSFMQPFECVIHLISQQAHSMRTPEVLELGIGLTRDLRGILAGALSKVSYTLFFEWLMPKYLGVVLRLLETWWDTSVIAVPILRFLSELVFNKGQRITFAPSSPSGIILFREASKALNIYGQRQLQQYKVRPDDDDDADEPADAKADDDGDELYKSKLKGISICLQIITRALAGDYVNFGVFELYNDKALSSSLETVIKLILSVPLKQSLAYSKVASKYYAFLEILFRNHTDIIVRFDRTIFLQLVSSLQDGLEGFAVQVSTHCAGAIDHLMCHRYLMSKKRDIPQSAKILEQYIAEGGTLMFEMAFV